MLKSRIRTIIVEDELPIREEITGLALQREELQIVGVGKNGNDLFTLLEEKKPDLALLDIELPVKDTMTVLNEINYTAQIIFITAYQQYAVQAFNIAAIDYLMKPLKKERFNESINRMIAMYMLIKNEKEIRDHIPHESSSGFLWARENEKIFPVSVSDIIYLEAENKYTFIHTTAKKKIQILRPLSAIIRQIGSNMIMQIHRKYAINTTMVIEMNPFFNGTYEVTLKGCEKKLPVSRRYASTIIPGLLK